ncbi:SETMR methyltransferase, partial [Acromyrmex charruanus]
MEKNKFHAVIKHLHMKGLTPKEIKAVNEFKRSRTSTCDALRSGRPIEAVTPEIIDKLILTDRRVKVRELVEATGISHGTVISILHEQLGMKKLSARWVPRDPLFTPETKEQSKQWTSPSEPATALLDRFNNILKKKTRACTDAKFNEFRYELLPHPAYSPDLKLNLKKWFGGKKFTREQLIAKTEAYFEGLNKSYYSDGLKKLKNRWIKCIELKGDYVEK